MLNAIIYSHAYIIIVLIISTKIKAATLDTASFPLPSAEEYIIYFKPFFLSSKNLNIVTIIINENIYI